jgi:hypothetical protein
MIYIGSCAKSGTHYTTEFLNRLGLRVGHESPGLDGMVSWYTHGTPRFFPNEINFDIDTAICLHQTREPLATISSLLLLDENSWKYIYNAFNSDLSGMPLLERCIYYYWHWHCELEDCTFQYQVEDMVQLIDILDLFQINYDKTKLDWAFQTPILGASCNKEELTWGKLLQTSSPMTLDLMRMANKYGYSY